MAERKLAVETETSENMSRTGFMNTPPPTPQMLPITEAKKAMAKRIHYFHTYTSFHKNARKSLFSGQPFLSPWRMGQSPPSLRSAVSSDTAEGIARIGDGA